MNDKTPVFSPLAILENLNIRVNDSDLSLD